MNIHPSQKKEKSSQLAHDVNIDGTPGVFTKVSQSAISLVSCIGHGKLTTHPSHYERQNEIHIS